MSRHLIVRVSFVKSIQLLMRFFCSFITNTSKPPSKIDQSGLAAERPALGVANTSKCNGNKLTYF
jgi:hypothetical protein